jgi:putative oxidoreductase
VGVCIVGFFDFLRGGFAGPRTTSLASLIAPRAFHHLGEEIQRVRPVLTCIFRSSNIFVSCTLRLLDDVKRPQGNQMQIAIENTCLLIGRFLLGLYFILPGISKITGYESTVTYMEVHNVPMISALLPLTIVMQLVLGAVLIVGFRGKLAAFFLAGLTLVISVYMHNFWDFAEGMERNHETQNFFKNMGITAGLLMVAALGTGRFSIDKYLAKRAAGA